VIYADTIDPCMLMSSRARRDCSPHSAQSAHSARILRVLHAPARKQATYVLVDQRYPAGARDGPRALLVAIRPKRAIRVSSCLWQFPSTRTAGTLWVSRFACHAIAVCSVLGNDRELHAQPSCRSASIPAATSGSGASVPRASARSARTRANAQLAEAAKNTTPGTCGEA